MTQTQKIVNLVKSGEYRITSYSKNYSTSVWTLEKYYPTRGEWIRVASNSRCVKAAAKEFSAEYNNNLNAVVYK